MHLFGLNWQLQETEGYAFENGQVKSDATASNAVTALSTENSKGQMHTHTLMHGCIIWHRHNQFKHKTHLHLVNRLESTYSNRLEKITKQTHSYTTTPLGPSAMKTHTPLNKHNSS